MENLKMKTSILINSATVLCVIIVVLLFCLIASGDSLDDEIPDPTPSEQANGWLWAPPDWPISSQPVGYDSTTKSFSLCYFSDLPHYQRNPPMRCPGGDGQTITLRQWCNIARAIAGANGLPEGLENGVCGE